MDRYLLAVLIVQQCLLMTMLFKINKTFKLVLDIADFLATLGEYQRTRLDAIVNFLRSKSNE